MLQVCSEAVNTELAKLLELVKPECCNSPVLESSADHWNSLIAGEIL